MKIYPSNVPSLPIVNRSVFTHMFSNRSLPASLPAFIDADTGKIVTRAQLERLSLEFAWGLRNELSNLGSFNLRRGDTVMIFSPNSIAWPILFYGVVAAGLRATLANSSYTAHELAHQWSDSRAQIVFVHPSLVPVVVETFKLLKLDAADARKKIVVAGWGSSEKAPGGLIRMEHLLGKGKLEMEEQFTAEQAYETVLLCYSSGTTGKPKGVETSHRNLTAICDIVKPAFPEVQVGKDAFIGVLPFFHIYGAVNLLQFTVLYGLPVVVMPRFEPVAFCKHIETYKITIALVVPPVLVVLARHPAAQQYDLKSLRALISGAAPLGAALVQAVAQRLASYGGSPKIIQGYGLTETSPTTHLLPDKDAERKVGSVGILLPNLEARLVVGDTKDADEGEPGELWIRGPTVMKGYLNNPSATKNSITDDGFFKTGDIAIRDTEGFFTIVDRQKELIKYKGYQVPPAELESVLLQHPLVADAGVIGIDSPEEATELPRAYVVHAKGLTSAAEKQQFGKEVQKWIQGQVAKHKFLRGGVVVVDAIPKSASGKILRRELRDRAKAEIAAGDSITAKL